MYIGLLILPNPIKSNDKHLTKILMLFVSNLMCFSNLTIKKPYYL